MLSSLTQAREAEHAQSFKDALPFRHVVIDDYLDQRMCSNMLEEFPAFETRYALNEMGEVGGKAVRTQVRDLAESYRRIDDFIRSDAFLQHVSRVTGIHDLLYDPDYEGGGTHENRHGQSLAAHIDFNYHPRTGWHRRLNLIVYLNEQWQADWGGSLELHSDPWNTQGDHTEAVLPLFNRCVIFETNEISWHGFSRIDLPTERQAVSRKSFAIYLYTRERPADETAPPHATIYVPDGMPAELSAGMVLSQSHLDELRGRFAGLRGQLRFLYEREKQFTQQLARVESALAEAHAQLRPDVEGYVRCANVSGYWPDGWCAREFGVELTPSQTVRGIELECWIPDRLGSAQDVRVAVSDKTQGFSARPGAVERFTLPVTLQAGQTHRLRVSASTSWRPASDGASGDGRELAFKLLVVRVRH